MALGLFVSGFIEPGQQLVVKGIFETIIDSVEQDIVIFDSFKTNKLTKLISNIDKCKVVKITDEGCNNWQDLREKYAKAIKSSGVKTLIFTKMFIWPGFTRFDDRNFVSFRKALRQGDFTHGWKGGTRQVLSKLLFILTASKLCDNVYHYVVDPKEIDFTNINFNHFKRLYYLKREGCIWIPLFENQLVNSRCNKDTKEIDFVLYCTAFAEERKWLVDSKQEWESVPLWDVKVICIGGRGEAVPQTEYYDKLSNSRYTAVIKSYDKTTFSSWRFMEAVARDCLPFIFSDVALEECKSTYPNIYDIILDDELVVKGMDDIKSKISKWDESKRIETLTKIKQTPEWKFLSSMNGIKKRLKQVKGVEV